MTTAQELEGFIDPFSPEVATLARACLKKMRKRLPGAIQLVYDGYNALAITFSPTEKAMETVFSFALYPRWVSLFFLRGVDLPDPHNVLKGSGKMVRHIVLNSAADLDSPAIRDLMQIALDLSKPFDAKGPGKILIRAVAAKQRPRLPKMQPNKSARRLQSIRRP